LERSSGVLQDELDMIDDTSSDGTSESGSERGVKRIRSATNNTAAIRWSATLNNPARGEMTGLFETLKPLTTYQIWGHEGLSDGKTEHFQGFCKFLKPIRLTGLKKLSSRVHWERTYADDQSNIKYCSKEDATPMESGQRPAFKDNGEREKERWDEIWDNAARNDVMAIPPRVRITSYNNIRSIAKDFMSKPKDLAGVCGEWLYGLPGYGKSHTAREENPVAYFKNPTIWWDGYQGEPCAILDDVDKFHVRLGYHLKIWADRYSFVAETKGSAIHIRPLKIVVTSQYQIEDIWEDEETRAALNRRFKCRRIGPLPNFPIFNKPPTAIAAAVSPETAVGFVDSPTTSEAARTLTEMGMSELSVLPLTQPLLPDEQEVTVEALPTLSCSQPRED